MASKRHRDDDNDDHRDDEGETGDFAFAQTDLTPRPLRRRVPRNDSDTNSPSASIRSSASKLSSSKASSSKASKVSRNSSPTKQFRNASIQETGFSRASFDDDERPKSLDALTQTLWKINEGFGILPKGLQDDLTGERVPEWMFGGKPGFEASHLPGVQTVRKMLRLAKRCFQENLPESSWNNDVHSRVLEWVMRDSPSSTDLLDYRCWHVPLLTAQTVSPYRPENAPSKMVDFCICVQPGQKSRQFNAIQSLCVERPGLSINHTDWGDLTKYPIAVSIETKGPEQSYDAALLQVATWHASQWRSLLWERNPESTLEFLPGIIVIKHDWYFVATVRDDNGKARTFERVPMGSTETIPGIYKLSIALLTLLEWVRTEYWPAFQVDMLGFPATDDAL
ncbi:hypothetical protein B0J13DRAFT_584507 [Dactylonectria estremocensis]|uniref:PD-(D/E)XK nuclease-like domain-containing protein n=1 Tax=Dactylonectria estremocensis TaxID=1079267 RepID=A0A9P9EXQ9_9HYPO|nr:hypothetical protein B0J13DRAFT_584507 [Dactylonectria estremocensis]